MKIVGWCVKHATLIDRAKQRDQCSTASKGRVCRWFEHKVPEYRRDTKRKAEGMGTMKTRRRP